MDCPVPSGRESKCWNYKLIPMYDPHAVLTYLFDECNLHIDQRTIQKYWAEAASRGCPWAQNETGDDCRIPVKIFGDDCVYDERLTKCYALVLSLPLWRPKSARNSRFILWAQKSTEFIGFEGLQPLLARMVWSLNLVYDQKLEKSGHRFSVCEIGGDWSWNRFFWEMAPHWNSHDPCPFCNVKKFGPTGYGQMNPITFRSNIDFIANIVGSGGCRRVNPLVLLRNFHMSLVQPCQLHNLHLGLLWTCNGGAIATFAELGWFGDPTISLALLVEAAWDDFVMWMKREGQRCSQSKFTVKMIFKKSHGAYFSAKGHNSRLLTEWLADCASRAWGSTFGDGRIFGTWLSQQPNLLHNALQDEQMAPLCFALFPGYSSKMLDRYLKYYSAPVGVVMG